MAPPSDLPDPSTRPSWPPPHRPDDESTTDRQAHVFGMMIGTALMFIGFLDVFLSISGRFEINVVPLLIYFSGIAVWSNAVVENPTVRYSLMAGSVLISLAFFHYGEVLFWHKQVVFWSTVAVVMYFMFKDPKPTA